MMVEKKEGDPAHARRTNDASVKLTGSQDRLDYRLIFDRVADAILIADQDRNYIDANQAASDLTGYSRDEILKMRVGDFTTPEERATAIDHFSEMRHEGRSTRVATIARKDGGTAVVESQAIDMGNGLYLGILHDISARVHSQRELQETLDGFSRLVETCHAAVISADLNGVLTSWNPAAEGIFGFGAKEAVGMPVLELVPVRYRERHLLGLESSKTKPIEEIVGTTLETEGLHKDGHEVPIEVSLAVGDDDGERFFTAVIRDMTEQREVVERLNDALQRLQFHVERMPLAYMVWDKDFRAQEWNPAAQQIFGYSEEEAIGQHAYDLVVPDDVIPAVDEIWADLLHGDESSHSINPNVRKDGSRIACEWFNTPLRDSQGKVRGVASMAMDISEREATEERLRYAQKLESLGVMAAGISHDFNSSLMVILGNSTLLRSINDLPEKAKEHIELIEDAGLRARHLIRHLLAYARTGRHNPQPTSLNSIINDVSKFMISSLGAGCELELRLTDDLPTIRADYSQVEQIILNLCQNAKNAMADEGKVMLRTAAVSLTAREVARCTLNGKPGDYVELLVEDHGCGMDKETSARIFDPFFTTSDEGHGLGLAAVLGILRQHGAMAFVESAIGRGTSFHVYFPVARDDKA